MVAFKSVLAVFPLIAIALAAPIPSPDGGAAYTGPGGQANGGNVYKSSS